MSKGIRTLLSLGAISAILGLVLSVAGLCTGGRLTNIHVYWDHGPRVSYRDAIEDEQFAFGIIDSATSPNVDPPIAPEAPEAPEAPAAPSVSGSHHNETQPHHGGSFNGDVRELEISIGGGRVILQSGDSYRLQVEGNPRYESELSDGEWEIYTNDNWNTGINWDDVVFTITLPAGAVLDEISLTLGAGTLTADALCCYEADLEVGAGMMTLKDFVCTGDCEISVGLGTLIIDGGALAQYTDVDCGMGTVKLKLERPDFYGYSVSGGMGSVSVDGNKYSGMSIDATQNAGADTFYQIQCGMGSVQLEFVK